MDLFVGHYSQTTENSYILYHLVCFFFIVARELQLKS